MPAYHPCPRCKRMIPVGVQYCDSCRPVAEAQAAEAIQHRQDYKRKQAARRYNARRDPKYQAFYRSKDWKKLSRAKLQAAHYRCEAKLPGCTGIACEVHHKQPIQTQEGWDRRFEWDNLEATCSACHNGRHPNKFKGRVNSDILDLRTVERELKGPGGGSNSTAGVKDNGHRMGSL